MPLSNAATVYGRARTYRDRAATILFRAAKLLEDHPEKWATHWLFRYTDEFQARCDGARGSTRPLPSRDDIEACCAVGAMVYVADLPRLTDRAFHNTPEGKIARRYADLAAAEVSTACSVVTFNDFQATGPAQVAEVLRLAADLLYATTPRKACELAGVRP